jgi:hypothetical protein
MDLDLLIAADFERRDGSTPPSMALVAPNPANQVSLAGR